MKSITPSPLGLLFFGRLEDEKGFDLIFNYLNTYPDKNLPFELYIFGSGSYEKGILELSYRFKQLHFFGWKPLAEIERYLDNIHYCLMPSRFLETFGLSALQALQWGKTVVGFRKGGLLPFINEKYAIDQCAGSTEFAKFATMIHFLEEEKKKASSTFYQHLAEEHQAFAKKYTPTLWIQQFQKLIQGKKIKKLVLVSDFTNKIGGIETYIHDTQILLKQQGIAVKLFGTTCPSGFLGTLKKIGGIALGIFNLCSAIRLYFFLKKEKPDLIWYHSLLRRIGWFPLWITRKFPTQRRMMYHDFGYFTPYPSVVTKITMIKTPLSLKNYLGMGKKLPLWKRALSIGKYCTLLLLKNQLKKQIDLHLVPSAFMEPIVEKSFQLDKEKVIAFPHFVPQRQTIRPGFLEQEESL